MSETKLHIEMDGNVLDVEGDSALVEKVYNDFKDQIASNDQSDNAPVVSSSKAQSRDADKSLLAQSRRDIPLRSDVAPLVAMTHTPELERKLVRDLKEAANR